MKGGFTDKLFGWYLSRKALPFWTVLVLDIMICMIFYILFI